MESSIEVNKKQAIRHAQETLLAMELLEKKDKNVRFSHSDPTKNFCRTVLTVATDSMCTATETMTLSLENAGYLLYHKEIEKNHEDIAMELFRILHG